MTIPVGPPVRCCSPSSPPSTRLARSATAANLAARQVALRNKLIETRSHTAQGRMVRTDLTTPPRRLRCLMRRSASRSPLVFFFWVGVCGSGVVASVGVVLFGVQCGGWVGEKFGWVFVWVGKEGFGGGGSICLSHPGSLTNPLADRGRRGACAWSSSANLFGQTPTFAHHGVAARSAPGQFSLSESTTCAIPDGSRPRGPSRGGRGRISLASTATGRRRRRDPFSPMVACIRTSARSFSVTRQIDATPARRSSRLSGPPPRRPAPRRVGARAGSAAK